MAFSLKIQIFARHMALHTLYMHRSHTLYLPVAVLSTWQDKLQVFSPFLLYVLLICHRLKQQAYIQTLSKSTPAGAGAGVVLQRSMILPAFLKSPIQGVPVLQICQADREHIDFDNA